MTILILGLLIFLGIHSVRIVAEDWRRGMRARMGEMAWKGVYSLVSALGIALIVWGVDLARQAPTVIWTPPIGMRHVAGLLTAISFILLTAAYVPRNRIKAALHHPMILGVKVWAFAHLLANGTLSDILLFGSFLVWSILCFRAARRRDRIEGTPYPAGTAGATAVTVVVGLAAWVAFAFWLHAIIIGVRPFG